MANWLQDVVGAGLAALVGIAAITLQPMGRWFEEMSFDLPFLLRPNRAVADVVIVSVDGVVDRPTHVELLNRSIGQGARAVVFTAVFDEPAATNGADKAFANALKRARGKVVLAGRTDPGNANSPLRKPIPDFAAVAPWGLLQSPDGSDRTIRRHRDHPEHASLAWKTAQLFSKAPTNVVPSRWINFYAPELGVTRVSADQVLRGTNLSPRALANKVVFIGEGHSTNESFSTPYSRRATTEITRLEIEATAFLNFWRGDWLTRLGPISETIVLVLLGGFFGLAFMGMRLRSALLLAIGAMVVIAGLAYFAFERVQLWFPWLVIVGVQIPVALGWAMLCEVAERLPRTKQANRDSTQPSTEAPTQIAPTSPTSNPPPTPTPEVSTPEAPRHIPDHTMVKCIGRGAYGEVWLARDVIGRHHAVKIVNARSFPQAAPYEREFKGIQHYAPIARSHPGLLQIFHVGRHDAEGYFFYIMELADDAATGPPIDPARYMPKTLASELARRGHFPADESIQLGLDLSSALQHLHEKQLLHRDLKPSNIIFVGGAPKLADIGLVTEFAVPSRSSTRLGTEGYLAPEGPGTPAADVYALGKVLYEVSTGRERWQFPEPPTTLGTRSDQAAWRQLHEVILTACETDPTQRYRSAAELHAALTKLKKG